MDLPERLDSIRPYVLSIFRIMFGLLILQHGLQKWFGFPTANPAFAQIQLLSMVGMAGVIEIIGGTLIALGLFTRYAAFIVSGEMAVGYFTVHFPRHFMPIANGGNLITAYSFATFYMIFAGPGPLSIDARLRKSS